MLLTIHDANLKKVAFIDNEKQSTLNYYDDTWTRNLETGSSTFEFTVFKKAIKSDTASHKTYNYLNEKAFISFKYHGKSYVFNVMTVEENEQTIKCYCENLNLELINEYANPYKAAKAMSFVEYCNAMDLLNFTHLSVGINEVSDQKRTLEWEGQDTKLARLLSLANKFDAEIDFDTKLNADSSIKFFKVNVYQENDDSHQGVGRVRNDIQLTYGKNLKSIKRKIDKTGIYTMIRPTGKGKTKNSNGEEVETIVTIGGLSEWSENNADGIREFYQSGEALYAPLAAQMYPSTFTSSTQQDQWIRKDIEVDSDNPTVIRAAAIRDLKKNAYPALTYEVDGFLDVEIGDTIRIYDDGFSPILLIKARVSDQKISFTNPSSNKTTFANFKALENNLSSGIQAAFERLFEAAKPYTIKLSTDNGVIFKNQIGESLVTPTLYKGGKPVVAGVTWHWSLDGEVATGMTYLVRGSSVTDTVTLTVAAYIGDDEVAVDEISLVNVIDGKLGTPGTPGADGRTPYLHIAYANSADGRTGFSLDVATNKLYMGQYTDFIMEDSSDPTRYKWTLVKGEKGDKGDRGERGLQGLQGAKGDQGIAGAKGADGRTQYTHIAYADSSDGRRNFSVSASNRQYIGMYVDFDPMDSTDPSSYAWTLVKGADGANGTPGKAGADGRTPYFHTAYANSSDGRQGFSVTDSQGKAYLGTYTDYTQADSRDYRQYTWSLIKGDDGNGIANVTNYYLASTQDTGVTHSTAGWTTTPQQITADKRYHWNYRVELYTDGTSKTTQPAVIGVHGNTGARGADGLNAATNITSGFTAGFPDRVVMYDTNPGKMTILSDGWARHQYTNHTNVDKRYEFAFLKPDGLTENQDYTFLHEARNNKSSSDIEPFYFVQDNRSCFWGNTPNSSLFPRDREMRVVRQVNLNNTTLGNAQYLVVVNVVVRPGKTLDVETRLSCYVGNYQGPYLPYQGGKVGPQGIQGLQGPKGERGIAGERGADGRTQYTHIAYADNATGGGFNQTDQTKAYIGMYQDFNATDSRNPMDYRWTKWKGSDGAQGVPGPKGSDGRTPYIHFAYAESRDGRTGFSTTQTGNKRYLGTYTDYTQADSTDPARYKWVDMVGTVEVGGRNLFLNSLFKRGLKERYSTYEVLDDSGQTQGQLSVEIDSRNKFKGANTLKVISTFNGVRNNQKVTFRTGGDSRLGTDNEMSDKSVMMSFYAKSDTANAVMLWRAGFRGATKELSIGTSWQYYSFQLTTPLSANATNEAILHLFTRATVWLAFPKVEIGTVSTDHTEAPEDIDADINAKADQVLTQEQLNALAEKAQIQEAELKAKASMEALSELEKAYQGFVSKNDEARKQSEADLIEAGRRIELLTTQFGGLKELKTFIDTYMSSSNEGLIIGKSDASSTIKVSSDRISMFSAGREVMYISQGVIHIDNGIFTVSVQVGKFRTEQHHSNADMNVIRYVG